MTDTSKQKRTLAMTDKLFLRRSTEKGASSAVRFLESHRDFLLSGTRQPFTKPILDKLDLNQILPTPALNEIRDAICRHMVEAQIDDGIKKMEKAKEHKPNKSYTAAIYDSQDRLCTYLNEAGEEKELIKDFDDGLHGRDWIDRFLFDGKPDWIGNIQHNKIKLKGEPWVEVILRADAIARILKRKPSAASKSPSKTTSKLGFGSKVKQDRASFSKG